jgi:hypothetical protein
MPVRSGRLALRHILGVRQFHGPHAPYTQSQDGAARPSLKRGRGCPGFRGGSTGKEKE